MAHKKAGGSSRNGRDSRGRRLGVKKCGGEIVVPGHIIVRQRGTKFHPGTHVGIGRDHTLFATLEGAVKFHTGLAGRTYVSVVPPAPPPPTIGVSDWECRTQERGSRRRVTSREVGLPVDRVSIRKSG